MIACRIIGKDPSKPFSRIYYEDTALDSHQLLGAGNKTEVLKAFRDGWIKIIISTSQVVLIPLGSPDFEINAGRKGWLTLSQHGNCPLFGIMAGKQIDIKIGPMYFTIEAYEVQSTKENR